MKKPGEIIRALLYRYLSFENYLYVLSKVYFFSFKMGFLRRNQQYEYPYFLKNIIKKGDVVIDIGANLGYMTRLFSKLIKTEGMVYAVEPIIPILNILRRNTQNLNNVKILPFALGSENKSITMGNNSKIKKGFFASGSNFVIDNNITEEEHAASEFKSQMRKGSEIFKDLKQLDFIKIDVEGYEPVIVAEMESIIMKFKPTMLIETRGENREKMLQFLEKRKYNAFVLNKNYLCPTNENDNKDILFIHDNDLNQFSIFIDTEQ